MGTDDLDLARQAAQALAVGRATHHVFLCADQTNPLCAPVEETRVLWTHLKRRVAELGLDGKVVARSEDGDKRCVQRSKVDCLRVCQGGPVAVVYPDGVWYGRVTPEVLDRILYEHVLGGRPVKEHVLAVDGLGRKEP